MSILFLDDSKKRTKRFLNKYPHAVTVETVPECIAYLQNNKWKQVYLDHDLNSETWVDSNREDCGMEVVRWIVENKPQVKEFIVHSHNHLAAPFMAKLLIDAGYKNTKYIPFNKLMKG